MTAEAPQRVHRLPAVFKGLRWLVRAGAPWRLMPHDLPPWDAVDHQTQRWWKAGVFEASVRDWRVLLRLVEGRAGEPSAARCDGRTLPSTPESGPRAGCDGAKRKRGRTGHLAVDTLGHRLAVQVTAAKVQERTPVAELAAQGWHLAVVKLPEAKRGFVRLPRRWAVESSQRQ